jgi:hypothetical protein
VTRIVAVREAGRTAGIQRMASPPAGAATAAPDIMLPPTPNQVPCTYTMLWRNHMYQFWEPMVNLKVSCTRPAAEASGSGLTLQVVGHACNVYGPAD